MISFIIRLHSFFYSFGKLQITLTHHSFAWSRWIGTRYLISFPIETILNKFTNALLAHKFFCAFLTEIAVQFLVSWWSWEPEIGGNVPGRPSRWGNSIWKSAGTPDLCLELTIACTVDNGDPNHRLAFQFPLNSLDDRLYWDTDIHIPRISFRQIGASKSENKGEFILDHLEHSHFKIAIYFTFIMRASWLYLRVSLSEFCCCWDWTNKKDEKAKNFISLMIFWLILVIWSFVL